MFRWCLEVKTALSLHVVSWCQPVVLGENPFWAASSRAKKYGYAALDAANFLVRSTTKSLHSGEKKK